MTNSQENDLPMLSQRLLGLMGLCGFAFVTLAIAVHVAPLGLGWDKTILLALHQTSYPALDRWARTLTDFGNWSFTVPFWGLVALVLGYRKQWRRVVYIVLTVLGSELFSSGLKYLFRRPRPHLWQSNLSWLTNPSFPSGHALSSMMFVALLIFLWPWKGRLWVMLAGAVFVLFIAWTRLYLGVHYPSDILAGWSAAIAWCSSVYLIYPPEQPIQRLDKNGTETHD